MAAAGKDPSGRQASAQADQGADRRPLYGRCSGDGHVRVDEVRRPTA
jgi:hypothetical protein